MIAFQALALLYILYGFSVRGEIEAEKKFMCKNSTAINMQLVCDGRKDCLDGSDEVHSLCFHVICPSKMYRCLYGACIPELKLCDGTTDCADNSDEFRCGNQETCGNNDYRCSSGECIPGEKLCNGTPDCKDKSDENEEVCAEIVCPENMFHCNVGGCVHMELLCNSYRDCMDGSDETDSFCQNCQKGNCKKSSQFCPPIMSTRLHVSCLEPSGTNKGVIKCNKPVPSGTVAKYECKENYVPSSGQDKTNNRATCQINGKWSRKILQCEPECGIIGVEAAKLVVHGWYSTPEQWPWYAAIYLRESGNWTYSCGGTLITEKVVLTAAHCVWQLGISDIQIGLGKLRSAFSAREDYTQMIAVNKILVQTLYQDTTGNYGSDIAIIVLDKPAKLSQFIRIACLDWDLQHVSSHLKENSYGIVAGMGMMEKDQYPDSLKMTALPVVSEESCLANQKHDFKKYVTYTTFCAGFLNGTGVCNGDSGGGLIFPKNSADNKWYLQGIVSVSPRRHGTSFCDTNYYTIFTKISKYLDWIKEILLGFGLHLSDEIDVEDDVVY